MLYTAIESIVRRAITEDAIFNVTSVLREAENDFIERTWCYQKFQLLNTGEDLAPTFASTNWTATNGWSADGVDTQITKVANVSVGTITPSGTGATPVIGDTYTITIVASAASGTITYTYGGVSGTAITATTIEDEITALTTDKLIITGTGASTATITSITIQRTLEATYGLPSGFIKDLRVEWDGEVIRKTGILNERLIYETDGTLFESTPTSYFIDNDRLRLIPKPNQDGYLGLWYVGTNTSETGTSPVIPSNEHAKLANYVIARFLETEGRFDEAQYYEQKYLQDCSGAYQKYKNQRGVQRRLITEKPEPIMPYTEFIDPEA
jgi:hypothetical protein